MHIYHNHPLDAHLLDPPPAVDMLWKELRKQSHAIRRRIIKSIISDLGYMESQDCNQIVSIPGSEVRDESNESLSLLTGEALDENCVKIDQFGPIVLNVDGTMGRISNWHQMSESEQANAARMVCKRNKSRAKALREQKAAAAPSSEDSGEHADTMPNTEGVDKV